MVHPDETERPHSTGTGFEMYLEVCWHESQNNSDGAQNFLRCAMALYRIHVRNGNCRCLQGDDTSTIQAAEQVIMDAKAQTIQKLLDHAGETFRTCRFRDKWWWR